jgi:hypothetical protein
MMRKLNTGAMAFTLSMVALAAQAQVKSVCDIHHLGYTQTQCGQCVNMTWSVSRVFPRGVCVATGPAPVTPSAQSCTLTGWGGATLPLRAPNFTTTGASVGVCRSGFDFAKSQFRCSSGTAVPASAHPTTNVTCSGAMGAGANPQVTINGSPCCNP